MVLKQSSRKYLEVRLSIGFHGLLPQAWWGAHDGGQSCCCGGLKVNESLRSSAHGQAG